LKLLAASWRGIPVWRRQAIPYRIF